MDPFEEACETDVFDDEHSNDEEPQIKDVLGNLSKTVSRKRASDLLHSMAASKDILFWTPRGQLLRNQLRRLVTRRTALWVNITIHFSLLDLSCCSDLWRGDRKSVKIGISFFFSI